MSKRRSQWASGPSWPGTFKNVYGRDWFDDLLVQLWSSDLRLAIFVWCFSAVVWVLRKILQILFRAIN